MALVHALRAAEREAWIWARLWRSTTFSTFVAPVLVLIALGVGLGGLVEQDPDRLDGLTYLDFMVPGLLVASAVQAVAGFQLWPVMAGHRWLGFHHAQVSTPIAPDDIFVGHTMFAVGRSALQATSFLLAGALLGGVASWWGVAAVPVAALTAAAFATPLAAYASHAETDAWFDVIMRMVVAPLYLFSGTLFSVEQLPVGLRVATQLFPMYHGVELARMSTTGGLDGGAAIVHLAVLLVWTGVGARLGVAAFRRRLGS